jgi:hypothetical protein
MGPELLALLKVAARDNSIPLNREIIRRLEESFTRDKTTEMLAAILARLDDVALALRQQQRW